MAYTKQNFRDGQRLHAANLHKIEDAIISNETGIKNANSLLNKLNGRVAALEGADYSGVDGMVVVDNMLYLTQNGEIVSDGVELPAGGGGGGEANNATMTLTNTTGWLAKTVSHGAECPVTLNWSSIDNEIATGNGVLTVMIGAAVKHTREVEQGDISVDLGEYLTAGSNSVRVSVADVYGNKRSVYYTVTAVAVSIESTFNAGMVYTDAITFPYTPVGAVEKVVHFELDGKEIGKVSVASSGREQTFVIPKQAHGAHQLRVWFDAEIEGAKVESNTLHYSLICVEENETAPIVACAFDQATAQQYSTLIVPYIVYDPAGLTTTVQLIADGAQVNSLTVDRTEQKWNYRVLDSGSVSLRIKCGDTEWTHTVEVSAVDINVSAETSGLELHLTSAGRSNNEDAPGVWANNGIEAEFTGFNFTSDGWQMDEDGITALRVTGDARLEIPLKLFETDFSSTGKTIELEFATRNVLNYDAVILSCMSGGRGLEITSQRATMTSEQSTIGTQYKEDEHVRLSFVVEKTGGMRFMYCYINGILSGVKQYPTGDDFSQGEPVTISIGSSECTIDLYCIRVYSGALTRYQVLDNWIADTQDARLLFERYDRNGIYDEYDQIVIDNLPQDLPYLVIDCPVLPSFKGDKKTCAGYYYDPQDAIRRFTFDGAEIDVQGTSSQYYYVKNFKIKFKGGFTMADGSTAETYQMNDASFPTSTFTFKADVASSEGANNVVLAELYNELCPVSTPPQEADSRVRQTIEGHPIVIFWDKGDGNPVFAGKYNFNNDKGTEEVFGFADGDESWEILQNGTDRVGFHSADFSGDGWKADFEARFPEDNTDTENLQAFAAWLASTDTAQASGEALGDGAMYGEDIYMADTEEYRLAKFRNELPDWASVDALVFYYVFTEVFLCIDQREKNAFPTLFRLLGLWMILFYDADSSLGTDNKGNLAFDYFLEDIDYTDAGEPVFNGQNSVLWANLRRTYYDEITAEYQRLRTDLREDGSGQPLLSYDVANGLFEAHQGKWPEAIFNEDGYKKSIEPMVKSGDGLYLPMLQGKKEQHRKWWLYNRFRYLDSKYVTGTSMTNRITIRAHAKANVSLTAYVNMYGHVYYNAEMAEQRMERGVEYEFPWAATGAEDAVIGINDADMLTKLGDLSPLMVELVDISKAVHLTDLKVGDSAEGYSNGNLKTLTLGNNVLLKSIDARNCPNYAESVDASGCTNIESLYFDGTAITGLSLPNGGAVKTLHLPGTIANLTLLNQKAITDFVLPSYSQITTLRLENVSDAIDTAAILAAIPANSRVRLIGIDWTFDSAEDILALYDRLDTMRGMDEGGNTLAQAQVSGTLHIDSLTGSQLAEMQRRYPYITIEYAHITSSLIFCDWDGTELAVVQVADGGDGAYTGETPTREESETAIYTFAGWSRTQGGAADQDALKAVTIDRTVYAVYTETPVCNVRYYSEDGGTLLYTDRLIGSGNNSTYGGSTPSKGSTAQYTYSFAGWATTPGGSADANAQLNVTGNRNLYAAYTATVRKYTVYFYNGSTLLQTVTDVPYGGSATYTGSTPAYTGSGDAEDYEFAGFNPTGKGITGNTSCYAQFRYTGYMYVMLAQRSVSGDYENKTVTSIGEYAFMNNANLGSVTLTEAVSIGTSAFQSSGIERLDLHKATSLGGYALAYCSALETVILRSSTMCSAQSTTFASSGPFASGGSGRIFVPAALVATYKADGVWSAYADRIYAIEDYPETWPKYSWDMVNYRIQQGDYASYYSVGDLIPLDMGTEGQINMQIAAFDTDELADGTGTAHISFVAKELLATSHRMNPDRASTTNDSGATVYTEGTGGVGGWEKSEMRTYLNDTILPLISADVQAMIKPVTKYSDSRNTAGTAVDSVATVDSVWIPNYREALGGTGCETTGATYTGLFTANSARIKYKVGASSASKWWLRSASSTGNFFYVYTSGSYSNGTANDSYGVALGFCV